MCVVESNNCGAETFDYSFVYLCVFFYTSQCCEVNELINPGGLVNILVTVGFPRGAKEAPVGGSAETVMSLAVSNTIRNNLINEDTV